MPTDNNLFVFSMNMWRCGFKILYLSISIVPNCYILNYHRVMLCSITCKYEIEYFTITY